MFVQQAGDVRRSVPGEDELRGERDGVDAGGSGGGVGPVNEGHSAVVVADHVVGAQVAVDDPVAVGELGPGGLEFGEFVQPVPYGGVQVARRVREQDGPAV